MSKDKENYGSAFLYAEDLISNGEYRTVSVEIEEVIPPNTLVAANKKRIDRPTLRFKGKEKMLVLCKTNASVIPYVTGERLEGSIGYKITLQPRLIDAFNEKVVAIRVIPNVPVRKSLAARLGKPAVFVRPKQTEPTKTEPKEQQQLMDTSEQAV